MYGSRQAARKYHQIALSLLFLGQLVADWACEIDSDNLERCFSTGAVCW